MVRVTSAERVGWRTPALVGIAVAAAVLYGWNAASAGYPPFYSMAVKSMSESWKALVYGAVDPSASVTIDKLAGSFVPQAVSARIFGFHQWSLALPQVVEGVVATLVMHRVVRRWTGSTSAGLIAAGVLGFTPVVASMFEHSMEDGALTMCLVLAADRYQYAVMHGRLRSLLFCGVWIGLGFQAKMLEAWLIVPAVGLAYLLCAPGSRARRVRDVLVAGGVGLLASLSWVLLYTFTPGADRPFIDGTTNNNAFTMVFGYNGLTRLGVHVQGSVPAESTQALKAALTQMGVPQSALGNLSIGTSGWGKLFGTQFGPEAGWLYPLAFIALVAGLWWTRRQPRTDQTRAGFVFWGMWLVVGVVVYSAMTIPHTAYLSLLAPPVAALSAAGIVLYRRTWLLPAAIGAEAAWAVYLAHDYGSFLPWLTPVVVVLAVVALIGLTMSRSRYVATLIGVVAMLASPFAWAFSTLDTQYSGTAIDATAGPVEIGPVGGGGGAVAQRSKALVKYLVTADGQLSPVNVAVLEYVDATQSPHVEYTFAADDWLSAQPYIDGGDVHVLPMGGFSGQVPSPTLAHVQQLVHDGKLEYFLLDAPSAFNLGILFGSAGGGPTLHSIDTWVRANCTAIPSTTYHVPAADTGQVLYRC